MTMITLETAQQELPALIKRVLAGEEIVIGTQGTAVRLTRVATAAGQPKAEPARTSCRGRGALKGQLIVGPEFFEQLSDEECGVAADSGAA